MARTKNTEVPQVGAEAPEFNLPSAQGGNLRLSMRTVRGPVIVAFYRGAWNEDDVSYFTELAAKEDDINLALGSIVAISVSELQDSRDFLAKTRLKSYVLYDYARRATPAWGLLEKDKEHGDFARPATFLVDTEHNVVAAWMDERPSPEELYAKVSGMTGLPKPPEEDDGEEKPKKRPARAAKKDPEGEAGPDAADSADAADATEKPAAEKPSPEKPTAEEREKRRAERKAAREADVEKAADGTDSAPKAEGSPDTSSSEESSDGSSGGSKEEEKE